VFWPGLLFSARKTTITTSVHKPPKSEAGQRRVDALLVRTVVPGQHFISASKVTGTSAGIISVKLVQANIIVHQFRIHVYAGLSTALLPTFLSSPYTDWQCERDSWVS